MISTGSIVTKRMSVLLVVIIVFFSSAIMYSCKQGAVKADSSIPAASKSENSELLTRLEVSSEVFVPPFDGKCQSVLKFKRGDLFHDHVNSQIVAAKITYNTGCFEGYDSGNVAVAGYKLSEKGISANPEWNKEYRGDGLEFEYNYFKVRKRGCCGSSDLYSYYSYKNGAFLGRSDLDPVNVPNAVSLFVLVSGNTSESQFSSDSIAARYYLFALDYSGRDTILDSVNAKVSDFRGNLCIGATALEISTLTYDSIADESVVKTNFSCGEEFGRIDATLEINIPRNGDKLIVR